MKHYKTLIALVLLLCLSLTCLTGCTENLEPVNLVLIAGVCSDESVFTGFDLLTELPDRPGSHYTVLNADGTPGCIIPDSEIEDLSGKMYAPAMERQKKESMARQILAQISEFVPDSDEIDMAGTIEKGAHALRAQTQDEVENILIFYCSGRSTSGRINFVSTPLSELDPETSAKAVASMMDADLRGARVLWYCLGACGGKQTPINAEETRTMEAFYSNLLTLLGASSVEFMDQLPSDEVYCFADKPVTSIPVQGEQNGLQPLPPADEEGCYVLAEERIGYEPDTALFRDESSAEAALRPFAEALLADPEKTIVLYSTCSCSGDVENDAAVELACARTEAVVQVLMSMNVPRSQIIALQVSIEDDVLYQKGLGTGEAGAVNRKTVIAFSDTSFAQNVLAKGQVI